MPTYQVTYLDRDDKFRTRTVDALDEAYVEIVTREQFPHVQKIITFKPTTPRVPHDRSTSRRPG